MVVQPTGATLVGGSNPGRANFAPPPPSPPPPKVSRTGFEPPTENFTSAALPFDQQLYVSDMRPHCLEPFERKLLTPPPPTPPHRRRNHPTTSSTPHTFDPISATAQVRRGKQPRRKRHQVPKTQKRRAMERVFGLSCGEAKGPVVPNMRVEWGLATVRVHRRAHRHRGRDRNGPAASCSMRSSGGTRTTSVPSKRTGSSLRKGGEGGSPTTPRQEATCTYWHQTRCTKCEC